MDSIWEVWVWVWVQRRYGEAAGGGVGAGFEKVSTREYLPPRFMLKHVFTFYKHVAFFTVNYVPRVWVAAGGGGVVAVFAFPRPSPTLLAAPVVACHDCHAPTSSFSLLHYCIHVYLPFIS